MQKKLTLSILAVLFSLGLYAQHNETHQAEGHQNEELHHGKHKLAIYGGFTHVEASFIEHETGLNATGKWVPTFGLDYFYSLNRQFDIGLMGDLELDSYYVEEHGVSNSHLERINVVVLTPVLKYKPLHNVGIIAGGGVELEFIGQDEMETKGVIKMGLEYEVPIANGWELTPSLMVDLKEKYSTSAVGISLGKRF